ncbi:MAG: hypothetical protein M1818_000379 [Claussenomyces sp. TS43310]|nr:MAG: hypothetical protein M1818_000379 [Claussenomyces sp. TS43310]
MVNTIRHTPSQPSPGASHHLIFFLPGNPGLISYYASYLATLHDLLDIKTRPDRAVHVYGQSFPGFEDDQDGTEGLRYPLSLDEQIEHTYDSLLKQKIPSGLRKDGPFDSVILIGHSVGTYMILELLRKRNKTAAVHVNVKAGILLFPTVMHLAQSPTCLKYGSLTRIPDLPRRVNVLVKGLLWFLPRTIMRGLIKYFGGMPDDAAEVTMRFLESRIGVWQSLSMVLDEMNQIAEDKWDEEIWGVENPVDNKTDIPKLIFYFGENDHYVANHARDALIASRGAKDKAGGEASKPTMLIDQHETPHSFCLSKHRMSDELFTDRANLKQGIAKSLQRRARFG